MSKQKAGLTLFLWIFGLAVLLLVASTVNDYGISWDEEVRRNSGEKKWDYYQAIFKGDFDTVAKIGRQTDRYPGFFDLTGAVLRRVLPFSDYLVGHIWSATLGVGCMIGTMRLAFLMGGRRLTAAILAGSLLMLTPSFYGHMFINPKDVPFAFGYIWSLIFLREWLMASSTPKYRTVLMVALFVGITMASRIGGLVLFCYLGLFLFIGAVIQVFRGSDQVREFAHHLLRHFIPLIVAVAIAFLILLFYWPAGQWKPFAGTTETLAAVTHFEWEMPVFYAGTFIPADELPFFYIIEMFLIKLPLVVIFGGMGALCVFFRNCYLKLRRSEVAELRVGDMLVYFAILFPVFYVIVRDSVLYNGLRHLLFVIPPLVCISALFLENTLRVLCRQSFSLGWCAALVIIAYSGKTLFEMIRLHPYQYIYYNELVGGVSGASSSYESDYWCTAYRELGSHLMRHIEPIEGQVLVNMEHPMHMLAPFVGEQVSLLRSQPENDDFYVAASLWKAQDFYYGATVVTVERDGVVLAVVKDRRNLRPEQRKMGYPESENSSN